MTKDEKEYFEERAAVLEYEFNFSRGAAEKEALRRLMLDRRKRLKAHEEHRNK